MLDPTTFPYNVVSRVDKVMRFGEAVSWKQAFYSFLPSLKELLADYDYSEEEIAQLSLNDLAAKVNTLSEHAMIIIDKSNE